MNKQKINIKELRRFVNLDLKTQKRILVISNQIIKRKKLAKVEFLNVLKRCLTEPNEAKILDNEYIIEIINLIKTKSTSNDKISHEIRLLKDPIEYPIYGESQIESGALAQMRNAMKLPVTLSGALMADAHEGYGLPIGGVLATNQNVVIPYAVGVDIACRMCMTIYDLPPTIIGSKKDELKSLLGKHTIFGVGSKNKKHLDITLFDKNEWKCTKIIRQNRDLAYSQLGTSGGGNHFVEWGEVHVLKNDSLLNLQLGKYLALLSHSGSRGFGSEIASHYSRIAKERIKLPREAANLAWLDLNSEEGQEYWIAMNLAGEYASANHHEIHNKISMDLGVKGIKTVENHHNFAWKEQLPDGRTVIIHRKGATPANTDNLGIIPGSMTHPGFIIRGKGNLLSLKSASHGAGRCMSRSKALQTFSMKDLEYQIKNVGVELIGGGVDEIPLAYKNIEQVMSYQNDLVEILAIFYPKIVRMAEPDRKSKKWRDA